MRALKSAKKPANDQDLPPQAKTLRDEFAMAAITALKMRYGDISGNMPTDPVRAAEFAFAVADAMMIQRYK